MKLQSIAASRLQPSIHAIPEKDAHAGQPEVAAPFTFRSENSPRRNLGDTHLPSAPDHVQTDIPDQAMQMRYGNRKKASACEPEHDLEGDDNTGASKSQGHGFDGGIWSLIDPGTRRPGDDGWRLGFAS